MGFRVLKVGVLAAAFFGVSLTAASADIATEDSCRHLFTRFGFEIPEGDALASAQSRLSAKEILIGHPPREYSRDLRPQLGNSVPSLLMDYQDREWGPLLHPERAVEVRLLDFKPATAFHELLLRLPRDEETSRFQYLEVLEDALKLTYDQSVSGDEYRLVVSDPDLMEFLAAHFRREAKGLGLVVQDGEKSEFAGKPHQEVVVAFKNPKDLKEIRRTQELDDLAVSLTSDYADYSLTKFLDLTPMGRVILNSGDWDKSLRLLWLPATEPGETIEALRFSFILSLKKR